MTTYWVKGYDPVYLEKQKQIARDTAKNASLISVKESATRLNNSKVNLSKGSTPNGSFVFTNNVRAMSKKPKLLNGLAKDVRSASAVSLQTDLVAVTPPAFHSIKTDNNKTADRNTDSDNVTKAANGQPGNVTERKKSVNSDLIQFDGVGGNGMDNNVVFTPVELSVAGDTPVDDMVEEILNTSNTSLRYESRS